MVSLFFKVFQQAPAHNRKFLVVCERRDSISLCGLQVAKQSRIDPFIFLIILDKVQSYVLSY